MKINVAINGYGTIGKRVADAVNEQEDMLVSGVTKTHPDFEGKIANKRGFNLYSAIPEKTKEIEPEDNLW